MFSLAYVILPFSGTPPADAIRASLARYQGGLRGDIPDEWLGFDDETEPFREVHETRFTFTDKGQHGFGIEGGHHMAFWHVETDVIRNEMRRAGLETWTVRFADQMDLDTFFDRYSRDLERHPDTGAFGRWRNLLGKWDWWDLGGRFDGHIQGERSRDERHRTATISSGDAPGRALLANIGNVLRDALDQDHPEAVDVTTDRNIELASTLLEDARAGLDQAFPEALVLPPGVVTDNSRWLDTWTKLGPVQPFEWLGLATDATWTAVCEAAYARFQDHWVAGVAYHH